MSAQARFIELVNSHFGDVPLEGVEIGTASGIWTEAVVRNLTIRILYTIDPYTYLPGEKFEGGRPQEWHNHIKAVANKRLSIYKNLVLLIMTSEEAYAILKNRKPFDFVYIDGNHNKKYIQYDVDNYYNLVREGGIFAGHDYNLSSVREVVDSAFGDRLNIIQEERIWWVSK